ncbi:hypothetical protein FEP99_06359 [Burkholderia pseudomultivorans]|nr:hypothetical protein [Burkholderia pseudomultivorans]
MSCGSSVAAKPGIDGAPCASRVPCRTRQNSSPSRRRASSVPAKVGGQCASVAASGPSPRPSAPWHAAQRLAYSRAPCITLETENGTGLRWKLVGTAGASHSDNGGHGASHAAASAAIAQAKRRLRDAIATSANTAATTLAAHANANCRVSAASMRSVSSAIRCAHGHAAWPSASPVRPSACSVRASAACARYSSCRNASVQSESSDAFMREMAVATWPGDRRDRRIRHRASTSSHRVRDAAALRGAARRDADRRDDADTAGRPAAPRRCARDAARTRSRAARGTALPRHRA